jgi:dihydrofolate reductase
MRKLKLQMQMTLNGFVAGPHGEADWMNREWDEDLKRYVGDLTEHVDCILLGRKLAQGFIPYWTSHPQEEGADTFVNTPKVVFTRTLHQSDWENTVLSKGDLHAYVMNLKQQPGGDIIAYGGATFVSSLIEYGLIDEYHLFINNAVIGSGMTIFANVPERMDLQLVEAKPFECGIVVLHYQPKTA